MLMPLFPFVFIGVRTVNMTQTIDKTLESEFNKFTETLQIVYPDIKRLKYHTVSSEYILFQFSLDNNGVFFTDCFYYSIDMDFEVLLYQIDYYLKHGELP